MFDFETSKLLVYLVPLMFLIGIDLLYRHKRNQSNSQILKETIEARLLEPASLHPVMNHNLCVGCNACVKACPESNVLGVINGKSKVITPANCIGHGACKTACPMGAIELVFGTATRGIDIPQVKEDFETNVPGIYIAGELGGMGLIRNAITQGRQAMESIVRELSGGSTAEYDVVIIGSGPAGFAASLCAKANGLKYITIEQESFGGTVAHFPRGKIVMTAPAELPLVGRVKFRETSKERLLSFWEKIRSDQELNMRFKERMENVTGSDNQFQVITTSGTYSARKVLLAIGRRGTPRKLGVGNEDLPKVVYRLTDPEQYRGRKVLVVGGGDSALEAATSIAKEPQTVVTLSYRNDAFGRAKPKNRRKVEKAVASGKLNVLLKSEVKQISERAVTLYQKEKRIKLENDAIIVCAGGILPTPMLKQMGLQVETKYGEA